MTEPILEVRSLSKAFTVHTDFWGKPKNVLHAVRHVSFSLPPGETVGLVGESGCGKSTVGKMLVGLYPPTEGEIIYEGKAKTGIMAQVQMIFQDPYASLDPRMTVGSIVEEPMIIHNIYHNKKERQDRVKHLLHLVGMNPEHANRFPHEFSGGQRQRVGIARALAINPKVIICDEPISALDVSIQAQVVNLLVTLQKEIGLTYLFIAHDLAMVRYISQTVMVMYLGSIVEQGPAEELYADPRHPYTKALLTAIPIADPRLSKTKNIQHLMGEVPSAWEVSKGCGFASRCPLATKLCHSLAPKPEIKGQRTLVCHHCQL